MGIIIVIIHKWHSIVNVKWSSEMSYLQPNHDRNPSSTIRTEKNINFCSILFYHCHWNNINIKYKHKFAYFSFLAVQGFPVCTSLDWNMMFLRDKLLQISLHTYYYVESYWIWHITFRYPCISIDDSFHGYHYTQYLDSYIYVLQVKIILRLFYF